MRWIERQVQCRKEKIVKKCSGQLAAPRKVETALVNIRIAQEFTNQLTVPSMWLPRQLCEIKASEELSGSSRFQSYVCKGVCINGRCL